MSLSFSNWRLVHTAVLTAMAAVCLLPARAATAQGGELFPEPFVVEHHLVQTDADGTRSVTAPVTDHYGGSWIVSVRHDGSRRVVDLARREVTEIRPAQGTWWRLSFDRLADLSGRLARAQRRAGRPEHDGDDVGPARVQAAAGAARPPELVVQELPAPAAARSRSGDTAGSVPDAAQVQRLRVVAAERADDPAAGVEVWVDRSLRLNPAARQALAAFERSLAGPRDGGGAPDVGRYLAAARSHAAGALPVRTSRALTTAGRDGAPGVAAGRLEDVTTRIERLDELPQELVAVPEGLRRVPHPMEAVVSYLEQEAELDRAMGGGGGR